MKLDGTVATVGFLTPMKLPITINANVDREKITRCAAFGNARAGFCGGIRPRWAGPDGAAKCSLGWTNGAKGV